ncbi:MAG: UbiX family flavin prenyltransferase, partial [Chloroflexi bacterium]|nr:UbiX family flavin prenyltransferase [Chloroflexota bacterium]
TIIVGISGASGAIYGIRFLEILNTLPNVVTHLVISDAAKITIAAETDFKISEAENLADYTYPLANIGAPIASGSFKNHGMIVIPCSMKSLSGIAHSSNDNLLTRAADVTLKERRRLVLVPREAPMHLGHLRLLTQASEIGAIIMPPMPAFYNHPKSLDDIINHTVQRCLDLLDISLPEDISPRWEGK